MNGWKCLLKRNAWSGRVSHIWFHRFGAVGGVEHSSSWVTSHLSHPMATTPEVRVVFAVSFESMYVRALGPDLPRPLLKSLSDLKIELTNLDVAYPLQTWLDALRAARLVCHPHIDDALAYEELGRTFVRSYFQTLIGRAVKHLLRAIGTMRSLERMRQNFRSGNNFSDSSIEKTGERSCRFHINHDLGHPAFILGIIHEGMKLAVEPTFRMTVIKTTPPQASFECSWD